MLHHLQQGECCQQEAVAAPPAAPLAAPCMYGAAAQLPLLATSCSLPSLHLQAARPYLPRSISSVAGQFA